MAFKKRTVIIIVVAFVVTIAALCVPVWFYIADKAAHLDNYRELITKTAAEKLNRSLTYEKGKASLTLRDGLSVEFTDVIIKEKDGLSDFLNVPNVSLRLNILPLLRNRLVLGKVILREPRVTLKRDRAGVLNVADLLERKEDDKTPDVRKILIENGGVNFLDQAAGGGDFFISLKNVSGNISSPFWTKKSYFHIKTFVFENANKAELKLDGNYSPAPDEKPFYESNVNVSIQLKGTDLKHYHSYLIKYTPIKQLAGMLNADVKLSGKFSDFKSKGSVTVKNAQLNYPGAFNDVVQPRMFQIDYAMKRNADRLKVDIGKVAVDNVSAKGRFEMDDLDKKDPLLKASAVTSIFVLKEAKPYVPWRIIPDAVGNFIQEHIKDGKVRLMEGKLKGRLSQIAHMNSRESVDVVSISAEVKQGIFEADKSAPVFHDISGILELKKRQFKLKKMKGLFGNSPCTMNEGGISDFAKPGQNIYTAEMKIQPTRNEVLWLLGKDKFRQLSFKNASTLFLFGKGTDDNFHIDASWDLTNVAYVYPDVFEKPKSRRNNIAAKLVINDDAVKVTSLKYNLPPMNINAAAMFYFSGKMPASFNIQSKTFDVREALPLLPGLRKFKPAGQCLLAVSGRGDLSDPASIQWNGNISLTKISLQPSARVKPLQDLTGKAFFQGSSMAISPFKGRIGQSSIQGNFRIDDVLKPDVKCQFNTNVLQTSDLGLQTSEGSLSLYAVKGQMGIKEKKFHVDNLSFVLGKSSFNFSGDMSNGTNMKVMADLTSPYVDSDDFVRLLSLKYQEKENTPPSPMELNATLRINDGKLSDIEFKKLYAALKFTRGVLDMETLEAELFDGNLKAKGKININPDGKNHYETNISINRMSLDNIQSYLAIGERTITGKLSISGDLSATGHNFEELKQTAAGTFDVRAEKGILKKFSVLSKIFSLLNVSQLAKLRLPDMAKGGMPYKKITFSTSLTGGVFSSKDFFIDSDAIQFSGMGNVDYLNKKLDCIVGVHPLQSLDFIAAKVPIAGWIITDERGKFITVNFKIGGTWDDPEVTTITAKSIGKGTINMFRKIFQLPGKLVTDTGEVIWGR